ncbi:MAG: endonuclease/exonuclease/phosphatase family protein [Campylobacteraceae bacterium]|nr:endonuclease/exonuclease/phosphatase family protein [Campylobacteraceae bacterium]
MFEPRNNIKLLKYQSSTCKKDFNLLCWNVAKLSKKEKFKSYLKKLIIDEKLDFLLLQEVKEDIVKKIGINDFSYILCANMETKKHIYGVMSAFKFSCQNYKKILTNSKELSFLTRKSSLFTLHKIGNSRELLIVNLHAINFVTTKIFKEELWRIKTQISTFQGALIVAGDFNTWNKKRVEILEEFTKQLSLKEVNYKDDKNIKRVFNKRLDYIFYRGLNLKASEVIKSIKFSDHNPIIVKFNTEIKM